MHLRIGPKKNEGFFNLFPLLFLSLPSFYLSLSPQDVSEHGRGEARTHQFTLCLVSHSTLLSPFSSPCPFLFISRGANESVIVYSDSTPVRSDQLRRCKALSTISANRQGLSRFSSFPSVAKRLGEQEEIVRGLVVAIILLVCRFSLLVSSHSRTDRLDDVALRFVGNLRRKCRGQDFEEIHDCTGFGNLRRRERSLVRMSTSSASPLRCEMHCRYRRRIVLRDLDGLYRRDLAHCTSRQDDVAVSAQHLVGNVSRISLLREYSRF